MQCYVLHAKAGSWSGLFVREEVVAVASAVPSCERQDRRAGSESEQNDSRRVEDAVQCYVLHANAAGS